MPEHAPSMAPVPDWRPLKCTSIRVAVPLAPDTMTVAKKSTGVVCWPSIRIVVLLIVRSPSST